MPRHAMIWNSPTLIVADTQPGLTSGDAFECQVTSAMLTPQPTYNTIPSTGCEGATQSPGRTGYQLDVAWLQDWSAPGGGLSKWAYDNDGTSKWVQILPDDTDTTTELEGEFYIASGGFGGTFGDGSAGATNASWPAVTKPAITVPAALP